MQVPVIVRNETYPNQQMRANIVEEKANEQPKFMIGNGSPRESSVTASQQQQQQPVPTPKSNNVENVGSTSKLCFNYFWFGGLGYLKHFSFEL